MYLGSIFENGRLCAKANGPNLNGCCLINTKGEVAGEVVILQAQTGSLLRLGTSVGQTHPRHGTGSVLARTPPAQPLAAQLYRSYCCYILLLLLVITARGV